MTTTAARPRRRYDSTLRREKAAGTRRAIVLAGAELLHEAPIRDWGGLTVRAVAERAGVNERTVYRHFANERGLRDAVMQQVQDEAGIDLAGMRLSDVAGVAARILEHVAAHPLEPGPELDPTLAQAGRRQHEALIGALESAAPDWSDVERALAASMLDVLWSVASYERLARDWQLESGDAIAAIDWVIRLVETAVREDRRPRV